MSNPLDQFDGDLYNLIPGLKDRLAPLAKLPLLTHGTNYAESDYLNHPTVWHQSTGLTAFYGIQEPVRPAYCYTDYAPIQCNAEQLLRLAFCKNFSIVFYLEISHQRRFSWEKSSARYLDFHNYVSFIAGLKITDSAVFALIYDGSRHWNEFIDLLYHARGIRAMLQERKDKIQIEIIKRISWALERFQAIDHIAQEMLQTHDS